MANIRPLKTQDFFTVAKIMSKLGNKALQGITKETTEFQAGILLMTTALEHAESDMMEWLADLGGYTLEEFSEQPFDEPLIIIEELAAREDLARFFERARALISKISTKQ